MLYLIAIANGVWRGVVLLALALVPYSAPLDIVPTTSPTAGAFRLLTGLIFACAAILIAARSRHTHPSVAWATTLVVAGSLALGVALPPSAWPLARAVWILAPALWIGVALISVALAPTLASSRLRRAIGASVVAWGILSLLIASPRLRSRQALLAANPGFEAGALAEASDLAKHGRSAESAATLRKCADANPDGCACISAASDAALDAHRYADVVVWTGRASRRCFTESTLVGARAEALAGINDVDEALSAADLALRVRDSDAHAAYARALAWNHRGDFEKAVRFSRQAIGWGRGTEARVFLAGLLIRSSDLGGAQSELDEALRTDPGNSAALYSAALYDVALVAQKQGRYRAAREGYLRVLAGDPGSLDARYNLVILTHGIGADAEARHHVDEMAKIAPDDPRIAQLRSVLSTGP